MGIGKFIRSITVSVGGYEWCIRYYPDGESNESQGHVSVYLQLLNKGAKVRVLYDLRLVNHVSGLSSSVFAVLKSPVVFDPTTPVGLGPVIVGALQVLRRGVSLRSRLICGMTGL
uniref:MATH domain-containing protein n=1 Tax=Triticum urartu TaxID=4572 RepID=A0A8R7PGX6_TRIUA